MKRGLKMIEYQISKKLKNALNCGLIKKDFIKNIFEKAVACTVDDFPLRYVNADIPGVFFVKIEYYMRDDVTLISCKYENEYYPKYFDFDL